MRVWLELMVLVPLTAASLRCSSDHEAVRRAASPGPSGRCDYDDELDADGDIADKPDWSPDGGLPAGACWRPTGPTLRARGNANALTLRDGRVLVWGGINAMALSSAELYDPATNAWTRAGCMNEPRLGSSGVELPDGRVLVAGGLDWGDDHTYQRPMRRHASVELFDPETRTWTSVASMHRARSGFPAFLLDDGRVVVAGGGAGTPAAEVYDVKTNTWSEVSLPVEPGKVWGARTLLEDGRGFVMLDDGALVLDRKLGNWMRTSTRVGRKMCWPIALPDGRVLVPWSIDETRSEVYDPATDRWSPAAPYTTPRYVEMVGELGGGHVVSTGGFAWTEEAPALDVTEMYDPTSDTWKNAGHMGTERANAARAVLQDGRFLVAGGITGTDQQRSAEVFDPACGAVQAGLDAGTAR